MEKIRVTAELELELTLEEGDAREPDIIEQEFVNLLESPLIELVIKDPDLGRTVYSIEIFDTSVTNMVEQE